MAVGNPEMSDDGLALHTARLLKKMDRENEWLVVDCGLYPENFSSKATRPHPSLVVILDAVDMGLEAGEVRVIRKKGLDTVLLSTHRIPLSFLVSYLEKEVKDVVFIGVQPWVVGEGTTLSPEVRKAAMRVARHLHNHSYQEFEAIM